MHVEQAVSNVEAFTSNRNKSSSTSSFMSTSRVGRNGSRLSAETPPFTPKRLPFVDQGNRGSRLNPFAATFTMSGSSCKTSVSRCETSPTLSASFDSSLSEHHDEEDRWGRRHFCRKSQTKLDATRSFSRSNSGHYNSCNYWDHRDDAMDEDALLRTSPFLAPSDIINSYPKDSADYMDMKEDFSPALETLDAELALLGAILGTELIVDDTSERERNERSRSRSVSTIDFQCASPINRTFLVDE